MLHLSEAQLETMVSHHLIAPWEARRIRIAKAIRSLEAKGAIRYGTIGAPRTETHKEVS